MNTILKLLADIKSEKGAIAALVVGVLLVLAVAAGLYFEVDLVAIAKNMGLLGG